MKHKLRLLDLALVALIAVLGWQMRREWVSAHGREQRLLQNGLRASSVPPLAPLSNVEPLAATTYAQVAQQNLFSKDRNPTVVIEPTAPPPEPPVPPFPVARGVMLWEGVPPTVVLSEKQGGPQKGYHPGDQIGEWKILSVDNKYVVFGWNGKEFKKRIDELLDRTPIVVAEAPAPAAAAPPPAAKSLQNAGTASGPGADVGAGFRACTPGDNSPAGTVEGGYKKVVGATPFGPSCHWEAVK